MFESIGHPKYAQPDGVRARAALTTEPHRRSFWDCLFGTPEYAQPGGSSSGSLETRSLTLDIRCPRITGDEIVIGAEVLAALPLGATNVKIWSSGTRAVTPNASVGAFLVGISPGGIQRLAGQITFRPLWVRFVNDAIEAESLEATLLVTFEL